MLKSLLLASAGLLLLVLIALPVSAQSLPGRENTPVPTPDLSGWHPVGIVLEHLESGILWTWMFGATSTSTSVSTDTPTLTPTPTVTPSPMPTATFTPSLTPTFTSTPDIEEPTQETTLLPPTEPGTDKVCTLRNDNRRKNIRSQPSLSASILAKWEIGIEAVFTEFQLISPYLWGRTTAGWAVVRENNDWWVQPNESSEFCVDLPGWPEGLEPPTPEPPATPTPRPPETPVPTITPVPAAECHVVALFNINERADHFTSADKVDLIPAYSTVAVDLFWHDSVYLWGRTFQGWFVVLQWGPPPVWWVANVGETPCTEVPGWPVGLTPPADQPSPLAGEARDGMHFSWFSDHDRIRQSAPYVGLVKCLTLTGDMCATAKASNADIVTIFRDYRSECPSVDQVYYDPAGYYQRLRQLWAENPGFDYYEIMNECTSLQGSEDYAALASFSIEIARRAAKDGYCILALSSGPGNPEISEFLKLEPYFRFADKEPCGQWPNGAVKYHGLSTHAAGYCPFNRPDFPWINWVWVAGRHTLFAEALAQIYNYDIASKKWPWFVTELYWGYGFADEDGAFTTAELQACVRQTQATLTQQGIIDGFAVWNFGQVSSWIDLVRHAPQMFQ